MDFVTLLIIAVAVTSTGVMLKEKFDAYIEKRIKQGVSNASRIG